MGFQTGSGVIVGITKTKPATHDAAGFDAASFDVLGEVTNVGEFGKEWEAVTHNPLASRGTKKGKGTFNNGTLNPTIALDNSDAGQALMKEALASDDDYYFSITLQDGSVYYMVGLVMKFRPNVGAGGEVVTAPTTIELQTDEIIESTV